MKIIFYQYAKEKDNGMSSTENLVMSSTTALSLSNCVLSAIMSGILLFGGVANAFSLHFFLNQRPATTTSVIFRMISSADLMTCFQASWVSRFLIYS